LNHKARVDTPGSATGKEQSDHQTCQSPLPTCTPNAYQNIDEFYEIKYA